MPRIPKPKRRSWMPERKRQPGSNQAFYNSPRWRKKSLAFRKRNPLCAECKRNGKTKAAQMVDHITPITQGGERFDDSNLQALCNRCHASKSGKEAHQKNQ